MLHEELEFDLSTFKVAQHPMQCKYSPLPWFQQTDISTNQAFIRSYFEDYILLPQFLNTSYENMGFEPTTHALSARALTAET